MMIGTSASTTFISAPRIELEPPADIAPKVDLYHVAYHRDNTSYDDLLKALLQKTSSLQKQLAAMADR